MSTKDRPRLGRGLKGLISTSTPTTPAPTPHLTAETFTQGVSGFREVALSLIDPNPSQPREQIEPLALAELVTSVKVSGILQPILLRPMGERFQLVAGHRRTEAAKQAGLQTIPAIIRADSTDELQAEWALIENIQRQDLNPIERAKAYRNYVQKFGLTHQQAAERLGEERSVITNYLRLLELNPGVQDLIARGILSAGHAKVLAGVTDPPRQDALANRIAKEGLSVRKLEEIVAQTPAPTEEATTAVSAHTRTLTAKSPHVVELEQELSRKLGTKLRIFPSKRKNTGKIIIQYFSLDEFDRLVERFEQKESDKMK